MSVFEVRTFNSAGEQVGILPGVVAEFSDEFGTEGYVKVTVPKNSVASGMLTQRTEVGLFIEGQEVANSRALIAEHEGDESAGEDAAGEAYQETWGGRTLFSRFRRAVVYPERWPAYYTPDSHSFNAASPGTILKTLIDRAKARGALSQIQYSTWNAVTDSNGVPWENSLTIEYRAGTTLLSVIENMTRLGTVEVRMQGRDLRLYNPATYGVNREHSVVLRRGFQVVESPYSESTDEVVNVLFVQGDEGVMLERTDAASIAIYGREEGSLSQGGTKDEGTLNKLADESLSRSSMQRGQYTVKVEMFGAEGMVPFIDFFVGDWISLDRAGTLHKYRVRQMSALPEEDRWVVNITLNDKFAELDLLTAKKVEGILGGAGADTVQPITGSGDTSTPKPPTGLIVSTDAYLDARGKPWGQVTLSWNNPDENTDNTAITDLYFTRIYMREDNASTTVAPWRSIGETVGEEEYFHYSPLPVNTYKRFALRAYDETGRGSALTSEVRVLIASDVTAPPKPATPVVTAYLGSLNVQWSGFADGGGAMPADFDHVKMWVSEDAAFDPATSWVGGTFTAVGRPTSLPVAGLTYGTEYYITLVAVDSSGNLSDPSTTASGIPRKVVNDDVAPNSLSTGAVDFDARDLGAEKTFYGPTEPVEATMDDLWIDTANQNQLKRLTGSGWVNAQSTLITEAFDLAKQKTTVYWQDTPPGPINLLANPGAEVAGGWGSETSANYPVARDFEVFHWSSQSVRTTRTATSPNTIGASVTTVGAPNTALASGGLTEIPAGETHISTRLKMRADPDSAFLMRHRVNILWADDANATVAPNSTGAFVNAEPGEWMTVELVGEAPAGATKFQINGQAYSRSGNVPEGQRTWMDDAIAVGGTVLPTHEYGDLWVDTADGNKLYAWNGTQWVVSQDTQIIDAINAAAGAQATADGKVRTFAQTSPPAGLAAEDVGDLWIDTDDTNKLYRWSGSVWVLFDDTRIAAQAAQIATLTTNLASAQAALATTRAIADGFIDTYFQTTAPTGGTVSEGDLWVDTDDNNKAYRYTEEGEWEEITDATISKALNDAAAAFAAADGKITSYYQASAPTGMTDSNAGDLWFDTDDGNKAYWYRPTVPGPPGWVAVPFGGGAIAPDALTLTNMVGEIRAAIGQAFYDDFSDVSRWNKLGGGANISSIPVADARAGSSVGRVVAADTTDTAYRHSTNSIPYDPNELYKITVRVRSKSDISSGARFYAGVIGHGADGTTLVDGNGLGWWGPNNHYSAAVYNGTPGVNWTEYTGYIKGVHGPGQNELSGDASTFEGGTIGGWTSIGGNVTPTNSTVRAAAGARSMLLTWGANAADAGIAAWTSVSGLKAGHLYRLEMKVWVPAGHPAVKAQWLQSFVTYSGSPSTTTGAWETIYADFRAGTATAHLRIRNHGASTNGQQVWVDEVKYYRKQDGDIGSDPRVPMTVHENVRFIRPAFWQYTGVNGDHYELDMMKVEAVPTGLVERSHMALAIINSALIENAAIIEAKIANLAVTNAKISNVAANKIITGELAAGQRIIAGPETSTHAEMTPAGFKAFAPDPEGGDNPLEVVRLGANASDVIAIYDATGEIAGSWDDDGSISVSGLYTPDPRDDNGNFPANAPIVEIYGTEFTEWIDPLPRGIVARAARATPGIPTNDTEQPYLQLDFDAEPYRVYRVITNSIPLALDTGTASRPVLAYLRVRTDGQPALVTSTVVDAVRGVPGTTSWYESVGPLTWTTADSSFRQISLLITYIAGTVTRGFIAAAAGSPVNLYVEDMGDSRGGKLGNKGISPTPAPLGGSPPSPAPTVKTYTTYWYGSASESYNGSNNVRADASTDLVQGYFPGYGHGDSHAILCFNGNSYKGQTGISLATAMSGTNYSLQKAEVYLYANHWHYNAGGTAIIRGHNNASLTSTAPSGTAINVAKWPKPGGKTVNITSIWNTSRRGIWLGKGGGTNQQYYGRFNYHNASKNKPYLKLTYEK